MRHEFVQPCALIVGVGPDLAAPGKQPFGLPSVKGELAKEGCRNRLQSGRDLHLGDHVGSDEKVEIDLNGAGAVHHVETVAADLWHVVAHDVVARFRHLRGLGEGPFRRAAQAEETDAERLADVSQDLRQMCGWIRGRCRGYVSSGAPESSNCPPGSMEIAPPPSVATRPMMLPSSADRFPAGALPAYWSAKHLMPRSPS